MFNIVDLRSEAMGISLPDLAFGTRIEQEIVLLITLSCVLCLISPQHKQGRKQDMKRKETYKKQRNSMSCTENIIHAHFHSCSTKLRAQWRKGNAHKPTCYLHGSIGAWGYGVEFVIDDHMDVKIIDFG